jgi:hypothetical protein
MKAETGGTAGAETRSGSWTVADALAAHLERTGPGALELDLGAEERADLEALARVARRLDARMKPLHPSPAFVRSLGHELVQEAERRMANREKRRRITVISAAVAGGLVSIASLVGGIVMLVRVLRARGEARQPSAA